MDPLTMALLGGGMNILGGLFGGESASSAANTQANAQLEAARIAAEAAKFRPIGVTTGFGSSYFNYDQPQRGGMGGNQFTSGLGQLGTGGMFGNQGPSGTGNLVGAGYSLNPQMQELFNQIQGMNMGTPGGTMSQGGPSTAQSWNQPQDGARIMQSQGSQQIGQSQPWNQPQDLYKIGIPGKTPEQMQYRGTPLQGGMQSQGAMMPQGGTSNLDIYKNAALANQGLFGGSQAAMNLANQYIGQSPQDVAAQYMTEQNKLLQPENERALAALRTNLANTGRTGLSISQGGEQVASNPEMQAYYNSLANQQNQLAAGARQAGQENVNFGMGLLGQGGQSLANYYSNLAGAAQPLKTNLDIQRWLDEQAQQSLRLGMGLGSSQAAAGAVSGNALQQGFQQAAPYQYAAGAYNPFAAALGGLGGMFQNYSRQQQRPSALLPGQLTA